jgi:hypothetical protein
MPQPQQPNPIDELHIESPVIDMQDLEHKPGPLTRETNKGVKIEPTIDAADVHELAKEDEAALEALEELEKSIRRQAPS